MCRCARPGTTITPSASPAARGFARPFFLRTWMGSASSSKAARAPTDRAGPVMPPYAAYRRRAPREPEADVGASVSVEQVRSSVYAAIESFNADEVQQVARQDDCVLLGPGGAVDSLGLVRLVMVVERRIEDDF